MAISLICLNAMIAFISKPFANILDDKIAVIAMDMYCVIGETDSS